MQTYFTKINSPVGLLTLIASDDSLHAVVWEKHLEELQNKKTFNDMIQNDKHPIIVLTKKQLSEYFEQKRTHFDIPLAPTGTPFQLQAWSELSKIPYGETISYGEQAKRCGDKKKARAVGMANGKNPISIIVPCHRVIGSNGKLTGFGGGLDTKSFLLRLETTAS